MDNYLQQMTARAQGKMLLGPNTRQGQPGASVLEVTFQEIPFADSTSAMRFMGSVGTKNRTRANQSRTRHLQQAVYESDD
jgi:hypothetical protein